MHITYYDGAVKTPGWNLYGATIQSMMMETERNWKKEKKERWK